MSIETRYSRNVNALSEESVAILQEKRVAVIGLGGLGGYIVEQLVRAGVEKLTVVDGDIFEESNLNRQLLSSEVSIGKSKAQVAKERLLSINSRVELRAYEGYLDLDNYGEILGGLDLLVDALDSIEMRFILRDISRELDIPIVHGSIGGWYGQVATIFPEDDTLERLYKGSCKRGIESELGNLGPTAGLVASIQSAEAIKFLTGYGDLLRKKVLRIDTLYNDYDIIEL